MWQSPEHFPQFAAAVLVQPATLMAGGCQGEQFRIPVSQPPSLNRVANAADEPDVVEWLGQRHQILDIRCREPSLDSVTHLRRVPRDVRNLRHRPPPERPLARIFHQGGLRLARRWLIGRSSCPV